MHRVRAGHNGIPMRGDNKGSNVVFHAVLQNHIAVMTMNAAHKHRADAVQHGRFAMHSSAVAVSTTFVLIVQPILANQFFHTLADVVNHSRCLRRKIFEIRVVRVICPRWLPKSPARSAPQRPAKCWADACSAAKSQCT